MDDKGKTSGYMDDKGETNTAGTLSNNKLAMGRPVGRSIFC
jgi:hypothetical protein